MPSIVKFARSQNQARYREMLRFYCLFLAAIQCSAGYAEVKFLKTVELPDVNLSLKIMPNSKESPPPPPTAYTYRIDVNGVDTPCDKYLPADLWRNSQIAGRWIDNSGNILTLAAITSTLATDFPSQHVRREEYVQKLAATESKTPLTDQELTQWVTDFIDTQALPITPSPSAPPRLARLLEFSAGNPAANFIMYAFQLNPNAPGQFNAPKTWFCAILQISPATDRKMAQAAMAGDFLKSLALSGKPRSQSVLPSRTRSATPVAATNRSPEFMASRQQVAESIRNMKNWWFVETQNYIILSNMKSRNSTLFKQIRANLETLRSCFEQFIPPRAEITSVSVIRIFATPEEYLQYTGNGMEWSYGVWMSDKKELSIRPAEWGNDAAKGQQILGTIYHEAFHQYIFYALDRQPVSLWFNEGHAEFFLTSVIGANRIDVAENPDNARVIDTLIAGGGIDFKGLLHMESEQFYAADVKTAQAHYATAWALVYFLRKAAPLDKSSPYAGIIDAYCDALMQLRAADKATDKAFENIDIAQLQTDFIAFWKAPAQRAQADRNRIFKTFKVTNDSFQKQPARR